MRLASCRLSERDAGGLLNALVGHPTLKHLDLSSNGIGSTEMAFQALAEVFKVEGKLETLHFAFNRLNGTPECSGPQFDCTGRCSIAS